MDEDTAWRMTGAERCSLAALVESLDAVALQTRSLCDAWTVKDVFAHLTVSPLVRPRDVFSGFAAARGRFDRAIVLTTAPFLTKPVDVIAADLRRTASSRAHPFGTTYREPLIDVLVHGQDVAVPLGLEREMPVDAAAFAAHRVWTSIFPFFPQRRLAGLELVSDDSDLRVGRGMPVRGRTQDLLLLLTGRYAPIDRLTGEGRDALAARVHA